LFKGLISNINKEVATFLFKGQIPISEPEQVKEGKLQQTNLKGLKETRDDFSQPSDGGGFGHSVQQVEKAVPVMRDAPKIGRNDPCPCGSGKKYKQCHGKLAGED
jgi:preprotein translocase subunit SecA